MAFLDEVFMANSAILDTRLGLFQKRQFDNRSLTALYFPNAIRR